MIERGGAESLRKMLAAYRENLSTPAAIKKVFGVEMAEFEKGYRAFLEQGGEPPQIGDATVQDGRTARERIRGQTG